jgi:DNA-directed RNA polymerase specialized sigma24 family protein
MSVGERVADFVPYLRRFARAVTCSQERGDAYVVATLEAMLKDPAIFPLDLPPRIALYRTFLNVVSDARLSPAPANGAPHPGLDAIRRNLNTLAPQARQAFLLVSVEEFSPQDAALVLDIGTDELQRLLDEAGREIARQMATNVIIIEDEPLIALDLERLVTDLGHRVLKIVRTEGQAIEAVERMRPGLVLADIHLADGSSGLDAVNKILRTVSVPVIFITAYPQLLLTGVRPEPTFLITKPFHPENVKAVISQALFLDIRGMPTEPHSASTVA